MTRGIPQLGMVIGYWFIVRETSVIPLTFRSGKAGDAFFLALAVSLQHLLPNSRFKVGPGTPATIGNIVVSGNFSHTGAQQKRLQIHGNRQRPKTDFEKPNETQKVRNLREVPTVTIIFVP